MEGPANITCPGMVILTTALDPDPDVVLLDQLPIKAHDVPWSEGIVALEAGNYNHGLR